MFSALELALTQSVRHLSKGEDGAVAQYLDRYSPFFAKKASGTKGLLLFQPGSTWHSLRNTYYGNY